jgi:4-amino-4-deoxy-L-arabinose transferase-like glycosyltransferase
MIMRLWNRITFSTNVAKWVYTLPFLILAVGLKVVLLVARVIPFNSDEAIVALMARHILAGGRPVFFYGQAYMGSLDAYLVAGGFALFGQEVWVVRLVQIILYLIFIISTVWIAHLVFDSIWKGIIAATFLAIPVVNVTLYTTVSLGGYGEALLIGNVLVGLTIFLMKNKPSLVGNWKLYAILFSMGFLAGLGIWANGLTLVYSFPVAISVIILLLRGSKLRQIVFYILTALTGACFGALPWWILVFQQGGAALTHELFGSAVAVEQVDWLAWIGIHLFNFLVLGGTVIFGLRPPWEIRWIALPLSPLLLAFWLGVSVFWFTNVLKENKNRPFYFIISGIFITLFIGFVFTSFGVDPSGRYFLPLLMPLVLVAADMVVSLIKKNIWRILMVAIILLGNLWGTVECALRNPPGFTTQFDAETIVDHTYDEELIRFLTVQDETRGYSNYWIAYPLIFKSGEELIFVPRLPYHLDLRYTKRDDRYPLYTQIVQNSSHVAYIIADDTPLQSVLRVKLKNLGVEWSEEVIGDYRVMYHLSRFVTPDEIGLGQ